jgi:hypothetical protein
MLSVVLDAAIYEPPGENDEAEADDRSDQIPEATAALAHGRAMAGAR